MYIVISCKRNKLSVNHPEIRDFWVEQIEDIVGDEVWIEIKNMLFSNEEDKEIKYIKTKNFCCLVGEDIVKFISLKQSRGLSLLTPEDIEMIYEQQKELNTKI